MGQEVRVVPIIPLESRLTPDTLITTDIIVHLEDRSITIVEIPFQMLRLRAILYDAKGQVKHPSQDEFQQLKEIVACDIMDSIKVNHAAGNITYADAAKLIELTNSLYEQILLHYQERGGDPSMGVMLPGALELPHDDIIFKLERLEELEEKNATQASEIAILTDRNTILTDENATLADENAALTDENEKLKIRIAELEASK